MPILDEKALDQAFAAASAKRIAALEDQLTAALRMHEAATLVVRGVLMGAGASPDEQYRAQQAWGEVTRILRMEPLTTEEPIKGKVINLGSRIKPRSFYEQAMPGEKP